MRKKLPCIMLIDDDIATNFYHKIILKDGGWAEKIIEMKNGEAAIEYLQIPFGEANPRPSLIFLDINMPRMNGWEFLDEYKKLGEHRKSQIVIVMLTTSLNEADRERASNISEVADFKHKPLMEDMLEELLQKL